MMLKYNRFESLYEAASLGMDSTADTVKNELKAAMGTLHSVPDFQNFKRAGEPNQRSIMFFNDDSTFALNYTSDKKLYSVDFWKHDGPEPVVTLYAKGLTIEDILPLIPEIAKNPSADINLDRIKKAAVPVEEATAAKKSEKEHPAELSKRSIKLTKAKEMIETDPHIEELEQEFITGNPDELFDELIEFTDMVIKGSHASLVVTGPPGTGKTYVVMKEIKAKGLKKGVDFVTVKGKSTGAAMYTALYENNGKLVVFDDCDSIFKDKDAVNILKGALDSSEERDISWLSAHQLQTEFGEKVPSTFEFTGTIIFISNKTQKSLDEAIKSRSLMCEIAFSDTDMFKYMEEHLTTFMPEESMTLKRVGLNTIKGMAGESKKLQINWRSLIKAVKILKEVGDQPEKAKRQIARQITYR